MCKGFVTTTSDAYRICPCCKSIMRVADGKAFLPLPASKNKSGKKKEAPVRPGQEVTGDIRSYWLA
jgi:hypothetical protein